MKKLVCSLLFVIMALFAVDRVGGVAMQWVARHTNDVLGPKLRYLQHDVHEDVVFVGASRCHHHYVPSIVADSLGITREELGSYSLSLRGKNFLQWRKELRIEEAKKHPITFDEDCPETTPERAIRFRRVNRTRHAVGEK